MAEEMPAEWRGLDGMAKANLTGPMLSQWMTERDKLFATGVPWQVAREQLFAYFVDQWEDE